MKKIIEAEEIDLSARGILHEYKLANNSLLIINRRLILIIILLIISIFALFGYIVYLLNDTGTTTETLEIQEVESIDNSHIKIGDDIWEKSQ